MSPDQWELVKAAFEAALDHPVSDRAAYLEKVCADRPEILAAVQDLLANQKTEIEPVVRPFTADTACVFAPGDLIARRFRIVRFIAGGGVGQVYEAYDEKLKLSVALKTLHSALAQDSSIVERFRREVRIAREVSHDNLCRVFDLVEDQRDGVEVACLSMELLNGESLADRIFRERPIPASKALSIIQATARGITALHENGIIHRDLKPSNIILVPKPQKGLRVVVTDFGLAKPLQANSALFESNRGAQVGSPYFMAPELWDGIPPSKASDIYALGLIVDEMVTKTPAFAVGSLPSLYYSKLREGPVPPGNRSTDLPAGWDAAILRCLEHNAQARWRSVEDLLNELERCIDAGPGAQKTVSPFTDSLRGLPNPQNGISTIAVMPFTDLSPDRDQSYFCDGIAEEIIHLLSQFRTLRVVARTSVVELRQSGASTMDIARRLNADFVLQGTLSRSGNQIRVTVQLADSEGCNVWSKRLTKDVADVFAVQEEIAAASIESVGPGLQAETHDLRSTNQTSNIEAYSCYLRGLYEFNQQTSTAIGRAAETFERAIGCDARFAAAYSGLADCYCTLQWYGLGPARETMPKAKQYAEAALALDPALASGHCTLGVISARYEWDWKTADEHFHQAMALNPGRARTHFSYALDYLTPMGRLDDALSRIRYALDLDPLSPILYVAMGGCFHRKRMYGEAVQVLQHALLLRADFYHAHWSLARALEQLGRYNDAVTEYQNALRHAQGDNAMIRAELGHCFGVMGKRSLAETALSDLRNLQNDRYVCPLCFGLVHLGLSQTDAVLRYLDQARRERAGALIWLHLDPRLDVLRSNERFHDLLVEMGVDS